MIMMFLNGIFLPLWASLFGAIWVSGRIVYSRGYTSEAGPKGRRLGGLIGHLGDVPLFLMLIHRAVYVTCFSS